MKVWSATEVQGGTYPGTHMVEKMHSEAVVEMTNPGP